MNPPWASCGKVMDFLHDCYPSSMRLFIDRPDVLVPGRWRWCEEGAELLPFAHIYAASVWDDDTIEYTGLGEVKQAKVHPWRGTPIEGLSGHHHCGNLRQWQEGSYYAERATLLLDGRGRPLCCLAGVPDGLGDEDACDGPQWIEWFNSEELGDSDDVGGTQLADFHQVADLGDSDDVGGTQSVSAPEDTGVLIGGTGIQGTSIVVATGGVVLGGVAGFVTITNAAGGVVLGGAASGTGIDFVSPAGGVVLGGAATIGTPWLRTSDGGIVIGGAAQTSATSILIGTGGVVLGGAATIGTPWLRTSDGGVVLGGSGNQSGAFMFVGTGGVVLDGSAYTSPSIVRGSGGIVVGGSGSTPTTFTIGSGGVSVGGSAWFGTTFLIVGSGGIVIGGEAIASVPVICSFAHIWIQRGTESPTACYFTQMGM